MRAASRPASAVGGVAGFRFPTFLQAPPPGQAVMDFATCFRLGRALRYGNAESFFGVYDTLLEKNVGAALSERQVTMTVQLPRFPIKHCLSNYAYMAYHPIIAASVPEGASPRDL